MTGEQQSRPHCLEIQTVFLYESMMNIEHDLQKHAFYTTVEGVKAYVSFRIEDNMLIVEHTIVPQAIAGRGIASALVKAAYDYALMQGLVPSATCTYAQRWLERHPEYINGR